MSEAELRDLAGWLFDLSLHGTPQSWRDLDLAFRLSQAAMALANVQAILPPDR